MTTANDPEIQKHPLKDFLVLMGYMGLTMLIILSAVTVCGAVVIGGVLLLRLFGVY